MAEQWEEEPGVAIIEAAVALVLLLSILLSGWGLIEIFHRGTLLEELVEGIFYDGVVSTYRVDPEDTVDALQFNHAGILEFVEQRVEAIGTELHESSETASRYFVQGALIEILWHPGEAPSIERVIFSRNAGQLRIPTALRDQIDLEVLAAAFTKRMSLDGNRRERFIRPQHWQNNDRIEETSRRMLLAGVSAAIDVPPGPARLLMESMKREPLIIRSSFNVLRKDL